jgi:peroxiredoxin family protein
MNEHEIPEWRKGAAYHRPLTDADGFTTGFEVTVYQTLWGNGRLCVGKLASDEYEHEYVYETVGAAVTAAKVYDGNGPPDGDWTKYRSRSNGDEIGPVTTEERTETLGKLMQSTGKSMMQLGTSAKEASKAISQAFLKRPGQGDETITIGMDDIVETRYDYPTKKIYVTVRRTDHSVAREITYAAVLNQDGIHDFQPGSRLRCTKVAELGLESEPGDYEEIQTFGGQRMQVKMPQKSGMSLAAWESIDIEEENATEIEAMQDNFLMNRKDQGTDLQPCAYCDHAAARHSGPANRPLPPGCQYPGCDCEHYEDPG